MTSWAHAGKGVTIGTLLPNTSQTTVYTKSTGVGHLGMLRITNVTGTAATATVDWYDASATATYRLLYQYPVPGNGIWSPEDIEIWMDTGDLIRVTAGTGNALEVIVTVMEWAGRSA